MYTQKERNVLDNKCSEIGYSEACGSLWNKMSNMGCGCSWYCGGEITNIKTSSSLKSTNTNTYNSQNASDLNYKTAWIEGAQEYGIGEFIAFEFPPLNPRITKITIANGYIKTKTTWKNNARVKQLKMYVDDELYAILNLKDVYADQIFTVKPIGYKQRKHTSINKDGKLKDDITGNLIPIVKIRFEILSVYEGDKYKDTAITEIYFDGMDVH